MDMKVEFKDNTKLFTEEMQKRVPLVLEALGLEAEKYAKEGCPVDTGRLRNSITYATSRFSGVSTYSDDLGNSFSDGSAKGTPQDNQVVIGTNVEYAQENELNNPTHKHFLRNAIANNTERYYTLAKKLLE